MIALKATATLPADVADRTYLGIPVENSYVIVSDDQPSGTANGWIYRLGNSHGIDPVKGAVFELAPGNDTAGASYKPTTPTVLILGAGLTDPTNPTGGYSGLAQDVAVYTTFVSVH
jgi:hypothetical protein